MVRVRMEHKHFALARGGSARAAADTAEYARSQGRFWKLHDLLLDGPVRRHERELAPAAIAAQLDLARLHADLPGCRSRVDADEATGKALGVESTPTLFANGVKLAGLRGLAELRLHVEDETAPGLPGRLTAGSTGAPGSGDRP